MIMTTIQELNTKIKETETYIEETKRDLGIVGGQALLVQLHSNLAELRKQETALLEQLGNDFVTRALGT